jgi:DNA polymerase-1
MKKDKTLFVIDGSSYIFRAFFGVPLLNNSKGLATNAVFGFFKMIKNTISRYKPDELILIFDSKEDTFRKKLYPEYKANREEMPEELKVQMPYIQKLVEALRIHTIQVPGVEADDVIASIKKLASGYGKKVTIISGDKDLMQLVDKETIMIDTLKNKVYNEEGVLAKFGVPPKYLADVLAIMGDSSDNIPGVKGIGAKGAEKLVSEYGSLENIYENLSSVKNKKHLEALTKFRSDAELSKELVTLKYDVDLDLHGKELAGDLRPDIEKLSELFRELEFFSELRELNKVFGPAVGGAEVYEHTVSSEPEDDKAGDKNANWVVYKGELIGHDLQHLLDAQTLLKYKKIFDTKLAAYVLSPGHKNYELDDISIRTTGTGFYTAGFPKIRSKLAEELSAKGLEKAYYDIDLPCIPVLREMEETGSLVDVQKLEGLSLFFATEQARFTKEIYEISGDEFNINSPKQLSFILFEKLGLTPSKKTETGHSTDQEVLEELSLLHKLPRLIIDYREITKLKNTYVEPLLLMAKNGDGRIRTTYRLDVTATGRLSSSEPNLQNIPVRTPYGAKIRDAFIAASGKKLISADYSQIELRLFAHLSQDPVMIGSFLKGEDIHTRTASQIFDVPLELVTLDQRRSAKAINFGIIYGKTPFGLAKELGISQSVASKIIKRYFESYAGIASVRQELVESARRTGYAQTMFGRKRYIPEINARKPALRGFAERNAVNSPIQGAASDIMKMALVKVWEELYKEYPKAKIIMHVHDELVVESPEEIVDDVIKLLRHQMENAVKLSPPLVVDVKAGDTWLSAH